MGGWEPSLGCSSESLEERSPSSFFPPTDHSCSVYHDANTTNPTRCDAGARTGEVEATIPHTSSDKRALTGARRSRPRHSRRRQVIPNVVRVLSRRVISSRAICTAEEGSEDDDGFFKEADEDFHGCIKVPEFQRHCRVLRSEPQLLHSFQDANYNQQKPE